MLWTRGALGKAACAQLPRALYLGWSRGAGGWAVTKGSWVIRVHGRELDEPALARETFNESTLHMRWPKYWSFSFSIIPSKEIPWLISFRMDWLDLLEVQGTLKSLLQYHSSKASILLHSAFFTVQLSHPLKSGASLQKALEKVAFL